MKAQAIIDTATADGLTLSVSGEQIKIDGDQEVIKRWIGIIKENKAAILAELARSACNVTVTPEVTQQPRYIVTVEDATTDPVIVNVSIAGLATFDLAIPLAKYDPFAIMDAMDHHSPMAALARDVAMPVPAHENERTVGLADEREREAA